MKFTKLLFFLVLTINIYANNINFDSLAKQAISQNKQIMVFFHMEHCPWCHKIINESLSDKNIQSTIKKYYMYIDIDVETSGEIIYNNKKLSKKEFANKFNIYLYPTTLMIDNIVVKNIIGYRNKNKYTSLIKYVGTKSYRSMDIKEFIANEDFNND